MFFYYNENNNCLEDLNRAHYLKKLLLNSRELKSISVTFDVERVKNILLIMSPGNKNKWEDFKKFAIREGKITNNALKSEIEEYYKLFLYEFDKIDGIINEYMRSKMLEESGVNTEPLYLSDTDEYMFEDE